MKKDQGPSESDKSKAYTRAHKTLRENHLEEFYDYLEEEYKAIGHEWKRPESAEEKARKAIAATLDTLNDDQASAVVVKLLNDYPELAGKILPANMDGVAAVIEQAEQDDKPFENTPDDPATDLSDPEIPEGVDPWGDNR